MYRKTSPKHKATIGVLALGGVALNLVTVPPTSTVVYMGLATLFTATFVGLLGVRSRWWLTPAGRAEFFAFLSFAVLAGWILSGLVWGTTWSLRNEVRDWLFMGFALATANLVITLIGVQQRELTDKEYAAETLRREGGAG